MSEQRKYSIEEIDSMREAIRRRIGYNDNNSYRESERAAKVEDELRTHMLNGTSAEDLADAAQKARDAYFERQRAQQEHYRAIQKRHARAA